MGVLGVIAQRDSILAFNARRGRTSGIELARSARTQNTLLAHQIGSRDNWH